MLGSKWRPFQKNIIFIIQMCLEKCQKFWKNQGKVREFRQEQNVETMYSENNTLQPGNLMCVQLI